MKKSDSNRLQSKNSMAAQPPDCPRLQSRAIDAYGGKLPNGKKMAAQTLAYGKAAKLRKNVFTKKGYVFAGCATSKANAKRGVVAYANAKKGKVKYKNAQAVKNLNITGKTVKLYAVWKKK